jgi:uncharacterized lipoprotein
MRNKFKLALLSLACISTAATSGCALSPQIIELQTGSPIMEAQEVNGRSALVRVRDLRKVSDRLGHRGGSQPENALLLAKPSLQQALTVKMQNSLQSFGFGGNSPFEPIKVDLAIEQFEYRCNSGAWVSQCQLEMELNLTITEEGDTFSQPFKLKQERSVATAPRVGYNEEWINQAIDKVWLHMLTSPQVKRALGINL